LIRCYITDRKSCHGSLLDNIERVAAGGVEAIQIREKDLEARDLLALTTAAVDRTRHTGVSIIVNGRVDVALAAGAHGVHLRSNPIPPSEWKRLWPSLMIGVSCHSKQDLGIALGADYVFLSPIFASPGKGPPIGLTALREAVRNSPVPVLALGGITWQNAQECVRAGAAGVAGIRLFQG